MDIKKTHIIIVLLFLIASCYAQSFSFVQLSDTHIRPNTTAIEDLLQSVDLINSMDSVKFVILSGDVTHNGDRESMLAAMSALDNLHMPYYVIMGNHESKWGKHVQSDFIDIFGNDRFAFEYGNCYFVGINTGDFTKPSEGHVDKETLNWLDGMLSIHPDKTNIVVTHHPLQEGDVDNWNEVTEILKKHNTALVLCGHYHRNMIFDCDGIPCVLTRSNLRGNQTTGGFSVITVTNDNITWQEQSTDGQIDTWLTLPITNIK